MRTSVFSNKRCKRPTQASIRSFRVGDAEKSVEWQPSFVGRSIPKRSPFPESSSSPIPVEKRGKEGTKFILRSLLARSSSSSLWKRSFDGVHLEHCQNYIIETNEYYFINLLRSCLNIYHKCGGSSFVKRRETFCELMKSERAKSAWKRRFRWRTFCPPSPFPRYSDVVPMAFYASPAARGFGQCEKREQLEGIRRKTTLLI